MQEEAESVDGLRVLAARVAVRLAELEQMAPGPVQLAGMHALRGEVMDSAAAVRLAALWTKTVAWCHAQSMIAVRDAVTGFDSMAGFDADDLEQLTAQEIATATHVSFAAALDDVALVDHVQRSLPYAWETLERGEITLAHLRALARVTASLENWLASAVDSRVMRHAVRRGWTPSELARAARRAALAIDPDGAAERAVKAKEAADVTFRPGPDQTGDITAHGDGVLSRQVMDSINIRAAQMYADGDHRPVGQRRFAAFAEAFLGRSASRPIADVVITIDLTTWLGLNQRPGELSGYGPISAETARELMNDANMRRMITDPVTGAALDLGRRRYTPSAALRRFIIARDGSCRFPGCTKPARQTDLDHIQPWNPTGETTTDNLHALCRMHHNLKTKKYWRVDVHPDGSETWTSPTGAHHTKPAQPYPIELLEPPNDDELRPKTIDLTRLDLDPPGYPDDEHNLGSIDDPLPEPPPIRPDEFDMFTQFIDDIDRMTFFAADNTYDQWQRFLNQIDAEAATTNVAA